MRRENLMSVSCVPSIPVPGHPSSPSAPSFHFIHSFIPSILCRVSSASIPALANPPSLQTSLPCTQYCTDISTARRDRSVPEMRHPSWWRYPADAHRAIPPRAPQVPGSSSPIWSLSISRVASRPVARQERRCFLLVGQTARRPLTGQRQRGAEPGSLEVPVGPGPDLTWPLAALSVILSPQLLDTGCHSRESGSSRNSTLALISS